MRLRCYWIRFLLGALGTLALGGCGILDPIFGCGNDKAPRLQNEKVTISEGVWGQLRYREGNFMPGSGCTSGRIMAVQRTVLFYELTPDSLVTRPLHDPFVSEIQTELVDSVRSDPSGFFQVILPPGQYSMFVREDTLLYANGGDSRGIYPVTVDPGKATAVAFDIDYNAVY